MRFLGNIGIGLVVINECILKQPGKIFMKQEWLESMPCMLEGNPE